VLLHKGNRYGCAAAFNFSADCAFAPNSNAVTAAAYLRGTFDWHIDGCTDDIPIMATVLSAHAASVNRTICHSAGVSHMR
jgi:hypothetical protein